MVPIVRHGTRVVEREIKKEFGSVPDYFSRIGFCDKSDKLKCTGVMYNNLLMVIISPGRIFTL